MKRLHIQAFVTSAMALAVGTTGCGGSSQQGSQSAASAKTPEGVPSNGEPTADQRRAVDAFAGQWVYHTTITAPGAAPVKADITMNCTKTARGRALVCSFKGDVPGTGPLDAGVLIGADPLDGKVHFMAMTSDDELHDHICAWKDSKNLMCDPLRGGLGGQAITEDLSFAFDGDNGSFKSLTHLGDGTQVLMEAAGPRTAELPAPAAPSGKSPEPSAEQKKLVEAFVGGWKWDAQIKLPNGTDVAAQLGLQCKATAGGKATLCSLTAADIAGRPYEATILVGHDPYDKSVHLMLMSSDDEVWYRPCAWKGDKMLACDAKRTGVLGMPVTTELTLDFAGAPGSTRWSTDLGDGKKCLLTARMFR